MTQNKLSDLNNHLFAQLERLGEEDLNGEQLKEEINRTKAISEIAKNIIANGTLALNVQKFYDSDDRMDLDAKKPRMLEIEDRT